jgi:hypothetical protein
MQPIPTPQLLDPDRVLDNDRNEVTADHQARAALLETALHESCDYAQQLWNSLDATRHYLMDSLPSDPRAPGPHPHAGATPTGPDDEQGWQNWIATFAAVNSTLCGPQGDSGYGLSEARQTAQERRSAPILQLHAEHPQLSSPAAAGTDPAGEHTPTSSQHQQPGTDRATAAHRPPGRGLGRPALTAVLVFLAMRGLRPRRSRTI